MIKKSKPSENKTAGECLCQGAGPALSEFLRRWGPPQEARKHFETARLEMLKGLRALLDSRIEQVSKRGAKGEKIEVV
jgi:hypothetical protein